MDYVQNMDRDFEADNLGMFIDWNDDQFQPTFLQTDIPLTGLDDANLMEHFNSQTQLPPLPPTVVVEPMTEIRDPISSWSSSSAEALTFVPNPLPPPLVPNTPLLNAPQLNNPLPAEGLTFDGAVPSLQSQDITLAGYYNELSELHNANSVGHQGIPHRDEQNSTNQLSVPNTIVNNNYNVININQSSSYPALLQQTPVQTNNERAYSSGAFAPPTASTLLTNQNTSNSPAAWSSRPQQYQLSASDVYGAQYFPNYTQSLQPFTPVQNQIDNTSELQQMRDLHSQDSRMSIYPTCPRSEPFSNLQPGLVTMPPNPFQPGYRSILSDPAAPSGSSVIYGQNPIPFATSSNSFGSGFSVHPMYPQLEQHQHPQVMMPYYQGQQSGSSMPQWSQVGEYNQRMTTPNLQRQISTSSQTLVSRFLGHSSSRTTEGTSSRVPNSRDAEIAPVLRLQPEAPVFPNEVHTSRNTGTSSTRNQPSETIQRILNMNPSRIIPSITGDQSGSMPTERVPYVPPRRGRPPKRRDPIEAYSQRAKSLKISSETGRAGSSSTSQRPRRTPNSVVNANPNASLQNPPSAPRNFDNAIYDLEFERQGQPLDPHLRFFKPPEK